jgi:hypothetical protein
MLVYPSSIDLSSRTLRFLTGQLTVGRQEIGTRWRRLPAARQALLALAHLRCGDTYAQLAAGFSIGIATVYRYIREAVEVLSALAPSLAEAMRTIRRRHSSSSTAPCRAGTVPPPSPERGIAPQLLQCIEFATSALSCINVGDSPPQQLGPPENRRWPGSRA